MQPHDVKAIVAEVLAEQQRQQPALDVDKVVLKAIATILTSFGISGDDRFELQADFIHLRKWRKSVDAATSLTFKVVVGTLVSGFIAALGIGLKAMLGK
jgi:hypothetical protein